MARRLPHHPAPFVDHDAYALQALAEGTAEPHQQKRALDWLVMATGVRDELFVPGQADTTCYLLGRRSIGLQVVALLQWKPADKEK